MSKPIPIADVRVGKRFRKEFGDIGSLAESIQSIGLLHPIVVNSDGILVAGNRRLHAAKQLGWDSIPCTRVDLDEIVVGEHAENFHRLNLTPSECVAVGTALEERERKAAKERQREAGGANPGKRSGSVKFTEARTERESLSRVAKSVGMSRPTYEKAKDVVKAAKEEPKRFGGLQEEMDRTKRVSGVARKLKTTKQADAIRNRPLPMPMGPFDVIVADPPWTYTKRKGDASQRGTCAYTTMDDEAIAKYAATWPSSFLSDHAILWLWTTNSHIPVAFDVCRRWGFTFKTLLTWAKPRMGMGDWLRGQTEHCLFAVRGRPTVELTNQTTLLTAPVGEHSEKPDEFYAMVEALCPGTKVELFSRRKRAEWTVHGLEVA